VNLEHAIPTVTLTAGEAALGAIEGVFRRIRAVYKGYTHLNNLDRNSEADGWGNELDGALAEQALCKWANVYWTGLEHEGAMDAGFAQARSTRNPRGCLVLHKKDKPHHLVVLVIADLPRFHLVGWLRTGDGQQQRYWSEKVKGRPAYFIPQSDLNPMSSLLEAAQTLNRRAA